jgi:DNA helicase-2/ATP-dependent DNA helicase PcrA
LYVGMTRAQGLLYLSCPVKQSGQEKTTLSRFISERSIQKHFSERGPDFAFKRTTVPDLARILRRPCPSTPEVEAARSQLERLEDDRYPATREDIDGDDPTWGASWDDKFSGSGPSSDAALPSFKRRRTDNDSVAVTMNRTSGFSMASTTMQGAKAGFTSARALGDLQVMQREAERVRMLAVAQDADIGKKAYAEAKKADTKPARAKTVKPRDPGQGAITSFFTRPQTTAPEKTESALFGRAPSLQRSSSALSNSTPLHDISNVQPLPARPSQPFQSLSLPSYKLHNRPMASKPKRTEAEVSTENTRYVLLSSSPVKPDHLDPPKGDDEDDGPESPVKQASSSFRAASTFHTTSMSQLQSQTAQRKTLGTRRTMQGWSVKHSSMPKPKPGR